MSSLMRNVIVCDHGKCRAVVAGQDAETVTQLRQRVHSSLYWRTLASVPADYCPEHAWRAPGTGERWELSVCGPLTSEGIYSPYTYQRWVVDGIWRYVPDDGGTPLTPDDPSIYDGRYKELGR